MVVVTAFLDGGVWWSLAGGGGGLRQVVVRWFYKVTVV